MIAIVVSTLEGFLLSTGQDESDIDRLVFDLEAKRPVNEDAVCRQVRDLCLLALLAARPGASDTTFRNFATSLLAAFAESDLAEDANKLYVLFVTRLPGFREAYAKVSSKKLRKQKAA